MDPDPVLYWDSQARGYDDKIFSTIDEDFTGIISETIARFAVADDPGPLGRCVDLGCGAGKYLPALASRFWSVTAYDFSQKLVELAQREVRRRGLENVDVRVADLSQVWFRDLSTPGQIGGNAGDTTAENASIGPPEEEVGRYGFAVMANVLIAPGPEAVRAVMLRNALRALCPGGRLLVVVPALESALYVGMRCTEAGCDGPYLSGDMRTRPPSQADAAELLRGGVVRRFGVKTKHFLEAEFQLLATRVGFAVEACERVTFRWRAELGLDVDSDVPCALLREAMPLPWDWLFLLRKRERSTTATVAAMVPPGGSGGGGVSLPALLRQDSRHGGEGCADAGVGQAGCGDQ